MTRNNPGLVHIGFVAVLAACLVLSACGRRGPPLPPPTTAADVPDTYIASPSP